jgi:hypothetical protein
VSLVLAVFVLLGVLGYAGLQWFGAGQANDSDSAKEAIHGAKLTLAIGLPLAALIAASHFLGWTAPPPARDDRSGAAGRTHIAIGRACRFQPFSICATWRDMISTRCSPTPFIFCSSHPETALTAAPG